MRRDPPDKRKRGKLHEVSVLTAWLARLEELSPPARRQAEVALRTGLRAEELRALSWSWVESTPEGAGVPAVLRVPAAKTRRERVLGLTPETLVALHKAREAVSGWEVPLFVGNHRATFRRACRELQYPQHITLRDLRHCHATWAAQGTGDAAAAQAALGHTDLRTTQRYLSATLARTASAAVAVGDMLGTAPQPDPTGSEAAIPSDRHPTPSPHGVVTPLRSDPTGAKAAAGSSLSVSRAFWMRIGLSGWRWVKTHLAR